MLNLGLLCCKKFGSVYELQVMLTGSELLRKLLLQILHSKHIISYSVCLINLPGLLIASLKLQVKRHLVLLQVYFPTVKITELQICYVVDF